MKANNMPEAIRLLGGGSFRPLPGGRAGARSDTVPFWRLDPLGNRKWLAVESLSIGFQIFSHHNHVLGAFLKTTLLPLRDCLALLGLSLIPLLVLEAGKVLARKGR